MNSGAGTARVCARVNEVLKALPTPTGASREEIFEQRNLWSEEIQNTCHQVIEYYKSILILVGQELYRPAASLSRSIHEACFRLEYLSRNKSELQDWMEWQMNRDYYFIKDFLQYETAVSGSSKRNLEKQLRVLVAVMGGPPDKRKFPWRRFAGGHRPGRARPAEHPDGRGPRRQAVRVGEDHRGPTRSPAQVHHRAA